MEYVLQRCTNAVGCIPFEQTTCRKRAGTFVMCDMESVIARTYAYCMRDAASCLLKDHALVGREDKAIIERFADLSNSGQRACD